MARTYKDAVTSLNTLQSNAATIERVRRTGKRMNELSIPEMVSWSQDLGYKPEDYDKLNLIHIAGTKGKGSTSAFISSILVEYTNESNGKPPLHKVGLFTSPHLRFVRERIQINNEPLTEDQFTRYFFEVWDRIEASANAIGRDPIHKPMYFRYLTLMAMHAFLSEGVDAAIIECGIGGEYDCTNVIAHPVVTGITHLGIDHTPMLGTTIQEIAWHKAGIMKAGTKCFTVEQIPAAAQVLQDRADEKKVDLSTIFHHPDIASDAVPLGLSASFQKSNASLAVAISQHFLRRLGVPTSTNPLNTPFRQGLRNVQWSGRCEKRRDGPVTWYIDGAHTHESIELAATWFAENIPAGESPIRALIFNQQSRDAAALVQTLFTSLATSHPPPFSHVAFCANTAFSTSSSLDLVSVRTEPDALRDLTVQKTVAAKWKELDPTTEVLVVAAVEDAVGWIRGLAAKQGKQGEVQVLVTGSLHLVGAFLEVIESSE